MSSKITLNGHMQRTLSLAQSAEKRETLVEASRNRLKALTILLILSALLSSAKSC